MMMLPLLLLLLLWPSILPISTVQAVVPYNHTVPNLPGPNVMATMGNPLKGLVGGSRWAALPLRSDIVPLSMEFFNVGVSVDTGPYIWTVLDVPLSHKYQFMYLSLEHSSPKS
jgi:hypothetical protein